MRTTPKIMPPLVVSAATVSRLFAACQLRTEKRNVPHHPSRCAETLDESLQERKATFDCQLEIFFKIIPTNVGNVGNVGFTYT
jgi:hypothetical protein